MAETTDQRAGLPCILCGRWLSSVAGRNQPIAGLSFTSPGHYGTTVFDPMDGSTLEIAVCDKCLVRMADFRAILHNRAGKPRPIFWKPSAADG